MQEYNNGISSTLMRNVYKGILNGQPQPNMLGGKRARLHPKAGLTQYDYPSTLAVGTRRIHQPNLLGAGFWQDFGKGFKQGLVGTAQVAAPIAGELAKEAALSYIRGGKRKGGKYSIGHFLNDTKDVLEPFAHQVVPVATNVASSVAKDAIKSYLSGGAMLSNRPSEFHNNVYPQALQSYHPQESHLYAGARKRKPKMKAGAQYDSDSDSDDGTMVGGDLKHYWAQVALLAESQGITKAAARKLIKANKSLYTPEARKPRGPKKEKTAPKRKRRTKLEIASAKLAKQYQDEIAAEIAAEKYASEDIDIGHPKGVKKALSAKAIAKMLSSPPKSKRTSKKKSSAAPDFGVGPEGVSAGSRRGGNWLDDVVKVSKAAAPYVVPLMMAAGRKPKRMSLPQSGHKREVARGDIVAAVMRQQGLSLPQASQYVKDQGLY
jgi:hypothetical protein